MRGSVRQRKIVIVDRAVVGKAAEIAVHARIGFRAAEAEARPPLAKSTRVTVFAVSVSRDRGTGNSEYRRHDDRPYSALMLAAWITFSPFLRFFTPRPDPSLHKRRFIFT